MTAKETLLEVGLNLFAEKGFESVGVAQIVEEAGVTKPTLYHHYGNKEGLLQSIIRRYGKELLGVLDGVAIYTGDVIGTMDRLVIAYIGFAKRYPVFFRLYKQLYQSPRGSDSYRLSKSFYDEVRGNIELLFTEISDYHTNLKGKEKWMSFSLLGLLDAYILQHLMEEDMEGLDEETSRQAAKQFLYGVFA